MANKEEEKILKITVDYKTALEGIKKYKQEIEDLKEAERNLKSAEEDNADELEIINAQRKEAEANLRVLRKEIQNNIKVERQQEGSLKQLRAALSNATKAYDEMSREERNSAKGEELKNHIKEITAELKGAEEETERFYRNVGNYKNSIIEALGINQGFAGSLMSMAENGEGIKGFFANATASVGAFGKALLGLLANPVFLAIAGIAGAGVAFKWFYDYNKGLIEATRLTKQFNENLSGDELKEHRNMIQAIADMYGKDFKEVLIASNTLVTQFGISAQEATTLLADGFHLGADVTDDWLDRIKEYSTFFKDAGVSASEFIAISVDASKSGVFGDKALDAIKEATIRLREMPTATQEALSGIGLSSEALQKGLNDGTYTMMEVIKMVSEKLGGLEPTSKEVGTAIADIFGGAGEDAGTQYLQTIGKISTDLGKLKEQSAGYYEIQNEVLQSEVEVQNALSAIFDTAGGQFERIEADIKIFINDTLVKLLSGLKGILDELTKIEEKTKILSTIFTGVGKLFKGLVESMSLMVNTMAFLANMVVGIMEAMFTLDADKLKRDWNAYSVQLENNINNLVDIYTKGWQKVEKVNVDGVTGAAIVTPSNPTTTPTNPQQPKGPSSKDIVDEYKARKQEIEEEAKLIEEKLRILKLSAEQEYILKMEQLEIERQLRILKINEEYEDERRRFEALELLNIEFADKQKALEKEKNDAIFAEVNARGEAMLAAVINQDKAIETETKRSADEQKRIEQEKVSTLTQLTGALSDLAYQAAEDNEALAKVAKGLAVAEIMIAQGVAVANAVKKATTSGATIWDTLVAVGTAVAMVTSVMSTAMKSVKSAKIGGSSGGGGTSYGGGTYSSSAVYNPMLAQYNSLGSNVSTYNGSGGEQINEEMMADATTRGVVNTPAPVVSVVEITEAQQRVKTIETSGDV